MVICPWHAAVLLLLFICTAVGEPLVPSYIDWAAAKPEDLCTHPLPKPKLLFIPDTEKCLSVFLDTYCRWEHQLLCDKYANSILNTILVLFLVLIYLNTKQRKVFGGK